MDSVIQWYIFKMDPTLFMFRHVKCFNNHRSNTHRSNQVYIDDSSSKGQVIDIDIKY